MTLAALLFLAQVLTPGQALSASCTGQFVQVVTSMTTISAACVEPPPEAPSDLRITVGHAEVALFEQAPPSTLRVMSVNRSVGSNIRDGITCLGTAPQGHAHHCRRWSWTDGSYPSPSLTWAARPMHFSFFGNAGSGIPPELPCDLPGRPIIDCFESFVAANHASYDVVSLQPDYLAAGTYMLPAAEYLAMVGRLRAAHPGLSVWLHTSSLPRSGDADLARLATFNAAVRAHHTERGGVLVDIAEILSTDPYGQVWLGITPYYTSEATGGHLGYPSSGKIRVAMAWHVALARVQGWTP